MQNTSSLPEKRVDNPWVEVLEHWTEDCLRCLWPSVHKKICWDKQLEQLQWESSAPNKNLSGMDNTNLLYKIFTSEENSCFIWIHIAARNDQPETLAPNLFQLSYQLYADYKQPILPLVLFLDTEPNWKPAPYQATALGYPTHRFEFQAAQCSDWIGQEETLLLSDNPFEKAMAIYLKVQTVSQDPEEHYQLKLTLHRNLLEKSQKKEDFLSLYAFMDRLMPLPEALNKRYHEAVYELERRKQVDYLINTEQFGIDQWIQKGFQAGIEHANREHIQGMLSAGIERSSIKQIMHLNDIALNRLLILESSRQPSVDLGE
jgi:hypothetical protein